MRHTAIILASMIFWLPGAGISDSMQAKPLRTRVALLEKRVAKLEARESKQDDQIAALRTLVCLQLPTC